MSTVVMYLHIYLQVELELLVLAFIYVALDHMLSEQIHSEGLLLKAN
jgi:hypothetical protein